ncbi:hypothetical protein Tco_1457495 [Tanacetum coccineum]
MSMDAEESIVHDMGNADEQPDEQTWFIDLVSAKKDPLTFDELMATPIDFSKFAMNRLKLDKITKADLVGPVYKLLKGTCKSSVELEYNMEECYKALSNLLDWTNPKGDRFPYDLSKPLPLKGRPENLERTNTTLITKTKAARYELVIIEDMIPKQWSVVKVGYNKDDAFGISHWGPKRQLYYISQINRLSKHDVYSTLKILSMVKVKVDKQFGYGYLEEIVVRREVRKQYTFKEGDFINLHLNDIEDMLLLVVQHKLFHLEGDAIVDLAVASVMRTGKFGKDWLVQGNLRWTTGSCNGIYTDDGNSTSATSNKHYGSYEVFKLKNIKKDDNKSFQDEERYEHVGHKVIRTQEGKRLQDDEEMMFD